MPQWRRFPRYWKSLLPGICFVQSSLASLPTHHCCHYQKISILIISLHVYQSVASTVMKCNNHVSGPPLEYNGGPSLPYSSTNGRVAIPYTNESPDYSSFVAGAVLRSRNTLEDHQSRKPSTTKKLKPPKFSCSLSTTNSHSMDSLQDPPIAKSRASKTLDIGNVSSAPSRVKTLGPFKVTKSRSMCTRRDPRLPNLSTND